MSSWKFSDIFQSSFFPEWPWTTAFVKVEFIKNFYVRLCQLQNLQVKLINPLQPAVAFLYPLKTSENLKGCNGLKGIFDMMIINFFTNLVVLNQCKVFSIKIYVRSFSVPFIFFNFFKMPVLHLGVWIRLNCYLKYF